MLKTIIVAQRRFPTSIDFNSIKAGKFDMIAVMKPEEKHCS